MIEILSGIACFLNIVNTVFTIKDKILPAKNKENIGNFLNDIGSLLQEVAIDFEQKKYPHDKCSIMFEYMNGMKNELTDKMNEEKITTLQNLIEESYRVEQLFSQLNQLTDEEKIYNINILKSIAGRFIGLGKLLRLNK
jgi:hypothetical protein